MTQRELGNALGVSLQQVQKYERGTNRISAGLLPALAEALNVGLNYFYHGIHYDRELEGSVSEEPTPILLSKDGLRFAQAFEQIADPRLRRRLLSILKFLEDEN
jgi:transcriptional regulator with XRE-family HTH domain